MLQDDKDKNETQITNTALEWSVKLLEGLNMFDSTSLSLISNVDQDAHENPTLSMNHILVHTNLGTKR